MSAAKKSKSTTKSAKSTAAASKASTSTRAPARKPQAASPELKGKLLALGKLSLTELRVEYKQIVGKPARSQSAQVLMNEIAHALAASLAAPAAVAAAAAGADIAATRGADASPSASTSKPRGRFKGMSVSELQQKYADVVGRPTGSTDTGYLKWKIREAEKGNVTVGPRETRTPGAMSTVSVRLLTKGVTELDAVWPRHGAKSRNHFMGDALVHYLNYKGETAAAALFAPAETPEAG